MALVNWQLGPVSGPSRRGSRQAPAKDKVSVVCPSYRARLIQHVGRGVGVAVGGVEKQYEFLKALPYSAMLYT